MTGQRLITGYDPEPGHFSFCGAAALDCHPQARGDAGHPLLESCGSTFYDDGMAIDVPVLTGARLVLRRPRAEDVEVRFRLGTHREIVEAYGGTFDAAAVFTRNDAQSQIGFIENHAYAWIIDVNGFIGHVRFFGLDRHDRRAALAIGIEDPAYLGKGYGSEAIRLALRYIFSTGLHRVSARVLAGNDRAIACYRSCGFQVEGREREAALVDGRWQDDIVMGVLEREFVGAST